MSHTKVAIITLLALLCAGISCSQPPEPQKKDLLSEKDVEWVMKGIKPDKNKIELDKPENKAQATLSKAADTLLDINARAETELAKYEPYDFTSVDELGDAKRVSSLRQNLQKYRDCKKGFYDERDRWLKRYRVEMGQKIECTGRLCNTADYYIEKLEDNYFTDLNNLYVFVLKYHPLLTFKKDVPVSQDTTLSDEFDRLSTKLIKSGRDLEKVQEMHAKGMKNIQNMKKEKGLE